MTMWTVQRMETAPEETLGLECLEGQYPCKVTLKDTDTGAIAVVTACAPLNITDPCDFLSELAVNYSPNDWTAECGSLATDTGEGNEPKENRTMESWRQASFDEKGESTPRH